MRYYVDNSSYFDAHPYRTVTISNAVRKAGGKNVRKSNKNGWSNQPAVVTFDASPSQLKNIEKSVGRAVGTSYIIVRHKEW